VERDKNVFNQLEKAGWQSMRLWECDIHQSLDWCVNQVGQKIREISKNHHVPQN